MASSGRRSSASRCSASTTRPTRCGRPPRAGQASRTRRPTAPVADDRAPSDTRQTQLRRRYDGRHTVIWDRLVRSIDMTITTETHVAEIAIADPATIKVFQQHHIDFCCGGRLPLAEACSRHGLDPDAILAELRAVGESPAPEPRWETEPLTALVEHIQARFHRPLRDELPRLQAMLTKVVSRHGDHLPETLPRLA